MTKMKKYKIIMMIEIDDDIYNKDKIEEGIRGIDWDFTVEYLSINEVYVPFHKLEAISSMEGDIEHVESVIKEIKSNLDRLEKDIKDIKTTYQKIKMSEDDEQGRKID